ncbi:hypothetical protein Lal_00003349 [Lupinus albus]|nr:hypothetical protein Lal_00003349 [Lupinus albus]
MQWIQWNHHLHFRTNSFTSPYQEIVDAYGSLLEGHFPVRGLYQALAIAAMYVQEQPNMHLAIADVVTALNYLASPKLILIFVQCNAANSTKTACLLQE